MVEMLEIYVLNLAITLFLFIILTFRAWIELKNYRIMWKELEWRKTREVARAQNSVFLSQNRNYEIPTLRQRSSVEYYGDSLH